jgi:hypothetical protein
MRLSQICIAIAQLGRGGAWSPLALWPDGIDSPGMWISPRTLTSEWQDYLGTTPVAVPGTVADSSNPVGLALDLKNGLQLGPELVTNGDGSTLTGWTNVGNATFSVVSGRIKGEVTGTPSLSGGQRQDISVVAGRTYEVSILIDITSVPNGYAAVTTYDGAAFSPELGKVQKNAAGTYSISMRVTPTQSTLGVYFTVGADASSTTVAYFDNISVREVPGNHMLQSTSVDRPLLSARVNYLWQDLSGTNAGAGGYTRQSGVTVDDLGSGVYRINFSADGQGLFGSITSNNAGLNAIVGTDYIGSIELSVESGTGTVTLKEPVGSQFADTDVSLTTTWTRFDTPAAAATATNFGLWIAKKAGSVSSCLARFPQLQMGSVATDYQRVTSASDYDSTGFPIAQLYDGVDDGMATAAFSAGTLIDGMDCMIAVRRDSAAATYLISDTGSRGFFEWESGDTNRPDVGAGTPTYYVDGVAVTATKGALFTALTAGDWHILEARGLDLSTWLKVEVSSLVSYRLNGPTRRHHAVPQHRQHRRQGRCAAVSG